MSHTDMMRIVWPLRSHIIGSIYIAGLPIYAHIVCTILLTSFWNQLFLRVSYIQCHFVYVCSLNTWFNQRQHTAKKHTQLTTKCVNKLTVNNSNIQYEYSLIVLVWLFPPLTEINEWFILPMAGLCWHCIAAANASADSKFISDVIHIQKPHPGTSIWGCPISFTCFSLYSAMTDIRNGPHDR